MEDAFIFHTEQTPAPHIFDASFLGDSIPSQFNAVKILLNGKIDSNLDWTQQRQKAEWCVSRGLRLFWEIDLGLFSGLHSPLSDQTQFLALGIALRHFKETLWPQFKDQTIGICLYRGDLNFFKQLQDENSFFQTYSCDAAIDYLKQLTKHLPDGLEPFVVINHESNINAWEFAKLTTKERFENIQCVSNGLKAMIVGGRVSFGYLTESTEPIENIEKCQIGVCLPTISFCSLDIDQEMLQTIAFLTKAKLNYRIISEISLTTDWEGLDYLIVASKGISPQGLRKLRGFCAAGGTVITIGSRINLDQEISFEEWQRHIPLPMPLPD